MPAMLTELSAPTDSARPHLAPLYARPKAISRIFLDLARRDSVSATPTSGTARFCTVPSAPGVELSASGSTSLLVCIGANGEQDDVNGLSSYSQREQQSASTGTRASACDARESLDERR